MSDYDRGPYTPPADRVAFDPREPVRSGPAPVTLIASALILLAVVGGVAFIYRHGFRHPGAAPAEVGAPVAQMKTAAPPQPAGVSSLPASPDSANAAPAFAPPPETPGLRTAPLPAAPVAQAPLTPAPQPVAASAPPPAPPLPVVVQTPAKSAPAAKPVTIASLTDAATGHAAAKPPVKPPVAKPPVVKPVAPPAVTAATNTGPAGAAMVQIGAFSSAALANQGWADVARLEPQAMAGMGKKVEPVVVGDKTLYRGAVTGFSSHASAQAFCDKLKGAGKACFVK